MTDKVSVETRSKIMKSIRSRTKLEDRVCGELWRRGLRFRRNVSDLFGKPDIAIKKFKVVIFLDSCFWHFCPIHGHFPKSNQDYWNNKLQRNIKRDALVADHYSNKNWNVLRIWEHQIKEDFDQCITNIMDFIEQAKNKVMK